MISIITVLVSLLHNVLDAEAYTSLNTANLGELKINLSVDAVITPISKLPIEYNFEINAAGLENDDNGTLGWFLHKGPSLSRKALINSGPLEAADGLGYYSWDPYRDISSLEDPTTTSFTLDFGSGVDTSGYCLSFKYHMHGKDIKRLSVYTHEYIDEERKNRKRIFFVPMSQIDEWLEANIYMELPSHALIEWEAKKSSGREASFAIDTIRISANVSLCQNSYEEANLEIPEFLCDFSAGLCGMRHVDRIMRDNADLTNTYFTLNTTLVLRDTRTRSSTAAVSTPPFMNTSAPSCVKFRYKLDPTAKATLVVGESADDVLDDSLHSHHIWHITSSLSQVDATVWNQVEIDLTKPRMERLRGRSIYFIAIQYENGDSHLTALIDDVEITFGRCHLYKGFFCDFNGGTICGMYLSHFSFSDYGMTWNIATIDTIKHYGLPSGIDGSSYVFTSSYLLDNESFINTTSYDGTTHLRIPMHALPDDQLNGLLCLRFDYYIESESQGILLVTTNDEFVHWSMAKTTGSRWEVGKVTIDNSHFDPDTAMDAYVIQFFVILPPHRSFIALDNINLDAGLCSSDQIPLESLIAPSVCSFEDGLCGMYQTKRMQNSVNDYMDGEYWVLTSVSEYNNYSLSTVAFNQLQGDAGGFSNGSFLAINLTERNSSRHSTIWSHIFEVGSKLVGVEIYYFLQGVSPNTYLTLEEITYNGSHVMIFNEMSILVSGSSQTWEYMCLPSLSLATTQIRLIIDSRDESVGGYIAIDSTTYNPHGCSPLSESVYDSCEFNSGSCSWSMLNLADRVSGASFITGCIDTGVISYACNASTPSLRQALYLFMPAAISHAPKSSGIYTIVSRTIHALIGNDICFEVKLFKPSISTSISIGRYAVWNQSKRQLTYIIRDNAMTTDWHSTTIFFQSDLTWNGIDYVIYIEIESTEGFTGIDDTLIYNCTMSYGSGQEAPSPGLPFLNQKVTISQESSLPDHTTLTSTGTPGTPGTPVLYQMPSRGEDGTTMQSLSEDSTSSEKEPPEQNISTVSTTNTYKPEIKDTFGPTTLQDMTSLKVETDQPTMVEENEKFKVPDSNYILFQLEGEKPIITDICTEKLMAKTFGETLSVNESAIVVRYTCFPNFVFPDGSQSIDFVCNKYGIWTPDYNACEGIRCPHTVTQEGTIRNTERREYGTVVTYKCQEGYSISHSRQTTWTRICGENGTWLGGEATCEKVSCAPLPIRNDVVAVPDTIFKSALPYETSVVVKCMDGMVFEEGPLKLRLKCQSSGKWLQQIPACIAQDVGCLRDPYIDNTILVPSAENVERRQLLCNLGYKVAAGALTGSISKEASCLFNNDEWEQMVIQCIAMECPEVDHIVNASFSYAGYKKKILNISCHMDHFLSSASSVKPINAITLECKDGVWNDTIVGCNRYTCSPPNVPGSQILNKADNGIYTYRREATISCLGGKRLSDGSVSRVLTCDYHGGWTSGNDTCQESRCPPAPEVENASIDRNSSSRSVEHNSTITYVCRKGYWLSPGVFTQEIVCQENNEWRPLPQGCQAIVCPRLLVSDKVLITGSSFTYQSEVTLECSRGHDFPEGSPNKTLVCQHDGTWSHFEYPFDCKIRKCPEVPRIMKATPDLFDHVYGVTITYTCDVGYGFQGRVRKRTIECLDSGEWSMIPPACQEMRCLPLPTWNNLEINDTTKVYGTYVNATCEEGYVFSKGVENSITTRCGAEGNWHPEVNECRDPKPRPKPKFVEAKLAKGVGAVAISVTVLIYSVIIMVDVATTELISYIAQLIWQAGNNISQYFRGQNKAATEHQARNNHRLGGYGPLMSYPKVPNKI